MSKQHYFNIDVACEVGVHAAVILDCIAYLVDYHSANDAYIHEGKTWMYNAKSAFAKLFPYMTERQVKYALQKLKDAGLIEVGNYNKLGFDNTNWYTLTDKAVEKYYSSRWTKLSDGLDKIVRPVGQNCPTNTINNNITNKDILSIDTKSAKKPRAKKEFVPPTLDEVREYARSRNSNIDVSFFYDYYNAGHWVDGKGNPVKNWKQKFLTWERNNGGSSKQPAPYKAEPIEDKQETPAEQQFLDDLKLF